MSIMILLQREQTKVKLSHPRRLMRDRARASTQAVHDGSRSTVYRDKISLRRQLLHFATSSQTENSQVRTTALNMPSRSSPGKSLMCTVDGEFNLGYAPYVRWVIRTPCTIQPRVAFTTRVDRSTNAEALIDDSGQRQTRLVRPRRLPARRHHSHGLNAVVTVFILTSYNTSLSWPYIATQGLGVHGLNGDKTYYQIPPHRFLPQRLDTRQPQHLQWDPCILPLD